MMSVRTVGRFTFICIILLQLAGVFWIVPEVQARVERQETNKARQNFVPGEVLVKFKTGTMRVENNSGQSQFDALNSRKEYRKKYELNRGNMAVLH